MGEKELKTEVKFNLDDLDELFASLVTNVSGITISDLLIFTKDLSNAQKKECVACSSLCAIGGRKLLQDRKFVLRFLADKKYATIGNNINVTLFSIIGHAIMPVLAEKGKIFAIKFKDVLGGDFLFGSPNLTKLSLKRKEALENIREKHKLTAIDCVKIQTNIFA